jgi:hypothetical protein
LWEELLERSSSHALLKNFQKRYLLHARGGELYLPRKFYIPFYYSMKFPICQMFLGISVNFSVFFGAEWFGQGLMGLRPIPHQRTFCKRFFGISKNLKKKISRYDAKFLKGVWGKLLSRSFPHNELFNYDPLRSLSSSAMSL